MDGHVSLRYSSAPRAKRHWARADLVKAREEFRELFHVLGSSSNANLHRSHCPGRVIRHFASGLISLHCYSKGLTFPGLCRSHGKDSARFPEQIPALTPGAGVSASGRALAKCQVLSGESRSGILRTAAFPWAHTHALDHGSSRILRVPLARFGQRARTAPRLRASRPCTRYIRWPPGRARLGRSGRSRQPSCTRRKGMACRRCRPRSNGTRSHPLPALRLAFGGKQRLRRELLRLRVRVS